MIIVFVIQRKNYQILLLKIFIICLSYLYIKLIIIN